MLQALPIRPLEEGFSVCLLASFEGVSLEAPYCFLARTPREYSLVCPTRLAPLSALKREDGWRGLYVAGELDFSLVGILAGLSQALSRRGISLFAVSTYQTDYLFVQQRDWDKALQALEEAGCALLALEPAVHHNNHP